MCSGSSIRHLEDSPSEGTKHAGVGATIFFTSVFAALAAFYALYTVFDSTWIAGVFGLLWGLMIFNLDRYIVSSMRKHKKTMEKHITCPSQGCARCPDFRRHCQTAGAKIFEKE